MKLVQREFWECDQRIRILTGVLCKNNLEIHVRIHEDPGEG